MIYPESAGIYRTVFEGLLHGIKQRLGSHTLAIYTLTPERSDGAGLKTWLAMKRPAAVIALGRQAFELYQGLAEHPRAIYGALDLSRDLNPTAAGISLSVAPDLFFKTLKRLLPDIRRVFVVYNPAKDRWLIELARAAAVAQGLTLHLYAASDAASATQRYRTVLGQAEPFKDALWLPLDPHLLDEENVLPLLLEQSWEQHLATFSNALEHARYGALFAVYPDVEQLGQHLAQLALDFLRARSGFHATIEPLREVRRALNLRVAHHLGINVTLTLKDEFDLVFPLPH